METRYAARREAGWLEGTDARQASEENGSVEMEGSQPMEHPTTAERLTRRLPLLNWRAMGLVLTVLVLGAAIGAAASVVAQDATPVSPGDVAAPACPAELHGPGAEAWVRAELYFGTTKPDGTAYTEEEWLTFLADEITPRFPAGLTVLTGLGQWQDESGILQERSQVLVILYPAETAAESSALLEEIRDAYEQQFNQTSVLRADITQVCTSF
jgi:hypothetical protein